MNRLKRKIGCFLFSGVMIFGCTQVKNDQTTDIKAPMVEKYSSHNRVRSGIALGGIGTGSVELRKDGKFYNWSVFNNYPLGIGSIFNVSQWPRDGWEENLMFFIVRYQVEGEDPKLKLLQVNQSINEGAMESIDYYYPWLSAIENIEYSGRFPFVNMKFTDSEMPLEIGLEAYSPFIPHDIKNSSLPGVYFNFNVRSLSSKPVSVMLIATQRNLVGYDKLDKYFVTELVESTGYKFFSQTVGGMDQSAGSFGTMGMASLSDESTWHLGWEHKHPYYENLLFENRFGNINDTEGRNETDQETGRKQASVDRRTKDQRSFSSIAVTRELQQNKTFDHSFLFTWHFPNAYGSHNAPKKSEIHPDDKIYLGQKITKNQGHYYDNFFSDASEVANYMINYQDDLNEKSKSFVQNFYESDVDQFVLDQINSQLNTFVTSTTLTKEMKFGIREGMTPDKSWGPNATIDVSLYGSVPVAALFPELHKNMMRQHKALQTADGEINHGLGYDLDYTQNGTWGVYHRVDMPGNYIQLVLRDYFWSNDTTYLREMWPSVKDAISYITDYRDKDNDDMPDMEGIMCSYDNFPMWGLSSYIQSQWLAGIKGAMVAAEALGDMDAFNEYQQIFSSGSALMDKHLWNGKYYRLSKDYSGLCQEIEEAVEEDDACMTDQIIGQWMANMSGLGYLFNENHVKSSLQSVMDMSFIDGFGLRNCTWPDHRYLYPIHTSNLWVDQANTPWTGVELAFASFLIYEGFYNEGLAVIKEVDDRYRKANLYWDHQEFGGHYYRPMSAWSILNAMLGMSIKEGTYTFDPKLPQKTFKLFFATPEGTMHFNRKAGEVRIDVLSGEFNCHVINLSSIQTDTFTGVSVDGSQIPCKIENNIVYFESHVSVAKDQSLLIK